MSYVYCVLVVCIALIYSMNAAAASTRALAADPILFDSECAQGPSVSVGAVGDFLIHDPLQKKAQRRQSFMSIWEKLIPLIRGVDIMYGNLEVPTARGLDINLQNHGEPPNSPIVFDRKIYTSYPLFNVHPQLVDDIKKSGFDIVSTANNHALDRGSEGVDLTIDELERVGLAYVGTRRSINQGDHDFYRVLTSAEGVTTAWIACTVLYGNADKKRQVLGCERDREYIVQLVKYLKNQVDAVIVTPHWGDEGSWTPNRFQITFGRELLEAGALAVLGAHPHVLQPMEKYITADGRETFIIYSLANFVSFQPEVDQKATLLLFFNIVRTARGATLQGVTYVPAYMLNRTGNFDHVEIKPIPRDGTYGAEGLDHILRLFPVQNLAFHDDEINFRRFCH